MNELPRKRKLAFWLIAALLPAAANLGAAEPVAQASAHGEAEPLASGDASAVVGPPLNVTADADAEVLGAGVELSLEARLEREALCGRLFSDRETYDAVIVSDDQAILLHPFLANTNFDLIQWSEAEYNCMYPPDPVESQGDAAPWGADEGAREACGPFAMSFEGAVLRDCSGAVPREAGQPHADPNGTADPGDSPLDSVPGPDDVLPPESEALVGPGAGGSGGTMYVWIFAGDRGNTAQKPSGGCNLSDTKAGFATLETHIQSKRTGDAKFSFACVLASVVQPTTAAWHPYEPSGVTPDNNYGKSTDTGVLVKRLNSHLNRAWGGVGAKNNIYVGWVREGNHNGEALGIPSQVFVAVEKRNGGLDWPQAAIVRHEGGHVFGLYHYPSEAKVNDCGYWSGITFYYYATFMNYCYAYGSGTGLYSFEATTIANQFWSS